MTPLVFPYNELDFSYVRSRGPGGQHVNKTNSAVLLRWNLLSTSLFNDEVKARLAEKLASQLTVDGDLLVRSETQRDQDQNKSECLRKLQAILQKALFVPKKRIKTKPTRSSQRKRLESKKKHSEVKNLRRKLD